MSQFSGKQDDSGPKNGRRNKGVMRMRREEKRMQAEVRNEDTPPERRRRRDAASAPVIQETIDRFKKKDRKSTAVKMSERGVRHAAKN